MKMQLLRKRNQNAKIWKILRLTILQKIRKCVQQIIVRMWWQTDHLIRKSVCVNHEFNQPSQQKAKIEMRQYPQKGCQLELTGKRENGMKGRKTVGLLRLKRTGPQSHSSANMCYSLRQGKKNPKCNSDIIRAATSTTSTECMDMLGRGTGLPLF